MALSSATVTAGSEQGMHGVWNRAKGWVRAVCSRRTEGCETQTGRASAMRHVEAAARGTAHRAAAAPLAHRTCLWAKTKQEAVTTYQYAQEATNVTLICASNTPHLPTSSAK